MINEILLNLLTHIIYIFHISTIRYTINNDNEILLNNQYLKHIFHFIIIIIII